MKNQFISKASALMLAAFLVLLLNGCATAANTETASNEAPAQVEEAVEPWDGDGMDIPLDGSSLEAFNTSMARVKAHTDPSSYRTLVNAIEYLLFYDLGAKHDRTLLAARLDGLTGHEVIDRVSWQKK
jgi:hypothetical protein